MKNAIFGLSSGFCDLNECVWLETKYHCVDGVYFERIHQVYELKATKEQIELFVQARVYKKLLKVIANKNREIEEVEILSDQQASTLIVRVLEFEKERGEG